MTEEQDANADESTGREYPSRPIASVAACVLRGERILVIRRAQPPSQGRWSVPGGAIELGETVHDAACRELREECGVAIAVDRVVMVEDLIVRDEAGEIRFHYVVTYLLSRYLGGEVRPDSDALALHWATREELDTLDMNPVVRENMKKAFDMLSGLG